MERCVDASVVVKWVLNEPLHEEAVALLSDSLAAGIDLIAPSLCSVEVDSVIRRRAYQGGLTPEEESRAYALLESVPVQIVNASAARRRSRELAVQFRQRSVYDSLYAALAELRACEFWTADEEFFKRVSPALPFVRFLATFP